MFQSGNTKFSKPALASVTALIQLLDAASVVVRSGLPSMAL